MICFQISIFEPLKTASGFRKPTLCGLWFAFKLVSLNHWKQPTNTLVWLIYVVICFQISIFEPLKTATVVFVPFRRWLWFAFKLVSLNHWKQHLINIIANVIVVICFQISIFEPLKTAPFTKQICRYPLWFAFKLVSLNHWKQQVPYCNHKHECCDLLSN